MAAVAGQLRELGDKLGSELPAEAEALAKLLEVTTSDSRVSYSHTLWLPASLPSRRGWICGRSANSAGFRV